MAWALTSNRKQQTYDKIWSEIINWSLKKKSPMKVKRFILDFEVAQRNSIERHVIVYTAFLEFDPFNFSYYSKYSITILFIVCRSGITGCWFHFCQCLYKNIGQLGLIPSYKDDAAIRTWLRSFMALPLVNNDILPYAIEYLQRHIPTGSDQCCKFLRYFEFQWLQSVPRQYWHVGNLIPRSNNWIEGNLFCFFNERGFLGQVNAIS